MKVTETAFHHLDRLRRWGGEWLERVALPRDEHPHRAVFDTPGVRLREYEGTQVGPVLLIVPAPLKRHYIWDLTPRRSVVRHAVAQGFRVFLAEWTEAPAAYGTADYAALIARCIDDIRQRTGESPHLATHSLGGVLCVAGAALHPGQAKSLTLVETPLHFGEDCGAFAPLLAVAPTGREISARFGCVPGSFLSAAAVAALPREFEVERYADFFASAFDPEAFGTHLRVERWALDEFPLPGNLYAEVIDELYREDRLMRGEFLVGGQRVGPRAIRLPVLFVFDPDSQVAPRESILPFYEAVASAEKLLVPYNGDVGVALRHVGALIGRQAHQDLWPLIFRWMKEEGAGEQGGGRTTI